MDGFPTLPIEIARLIFLEAVRIRGVKRAARLRFVSQSWSYEVTEAILRSGILKDVKFLFSTPIWPTYLVHIILRKGPPLSRPLRIIRQVAERVLIFRGESISDDALRKYLLELCQLTPGWKRRGQFSPEWLRAPEQTEAPMESIEDSDEFFKEALLAAAACSNEKALVKQLLLGMKDYPHLIFQEGFHAHKPILNFPLHIAAFKGNVEVMRMLLEVLQDPRHLEEARREAAEYAALGNQMTTLELCLDPKYTSHNPSLLKAASNTTSTDIFDRVLHLCKDHLVKDGGREVPNPKSDDELLAEFLFDRFHEAVASGDLKMAKHLVQLGVTPRDRPIHCEYTWPPRLIRSAASGGYTSVIAYLLQNKVPISSRSLESAVRHGNPSCVKLLLAHGATDRFNPGSAFLIALWKENEPVLRMLIESGMMIDEAIKSYAVDICAKEGLLSMSRLLIEYDI